MIQITNEMIDVNYSDTFTIPMDVNEEDRTSVEQSPVETNVDTGTDASVPVSQPRTFTITVGPKLSGGLRLVDISLDGTSLTACEIDCDSAEARSEFIEGLRDTLPLDVEEMMSLDGLIVESVNATDGTAADATTCENRETSKRGSTSEQIVALFRDVKFFHTPEQKPYASISSGKHHEAIALKSERFRTYAARLYYEFVDRPASEQALKEAVGTLIGKALYGTDEAESVYIRYAQHEGSIYADLANPDCPYIQIDADGWRPCEKPPVHFRRPNGMLPLPKPEAGGSAQEIKKFVNVADADLPLFLGFLLAAVIPSGPYPIMVLHGEQGSAKTTTARIIGKMIDPRQAGVRAPSNSVQDLMVMASNNYLLQFDNISYVKDEMSDAMCRLSTGGGFGSRELYSDLDEITIDVQRPVVLNGIESFVGRSDLADRSIALTLPRISDTERRSDVQLTADFERARPRILGALFNAVAACLKNAGQIKLESLPRMADFFVRVTAAEEALGLEPGEFDKAYSANRGALHMLALESSSFATVLMRFLKKNVSPVSPYVGTATKLLGELNNLAEFDERRVSGWPKNGRSLSGNLQRLAPNLRYFGIVVDYHRKSDERLITISRVAKGGEPLDEVASDGEDRSERRGSASVSTVDRASVAKPSRVA